jgi:hypothetical protein
MAAVSGLLAGSAAVRASALSALPHVPTLAEGLAPDSGEVLAVMALARRDADEDNAAAAEAVWTQVGWGWEGEVVGQGVTGMCAHNQMGLHALGLLKEDVQARLAQSGWSSGLGW